ncbi:MAG: cytochrome c biogenesis protein CcdA [Deferribacteraceae bacterium]|nr:cytochrome c biogenesis protein CcdA [Deferribacteraceae bacterium]
MDILTAFTAGILSFLSPCILPLLPGYLSFLAGNTLNGTRDNRRAITGAFIFGLGFTLVFIAMGATATAFGRMLIQYQGIITKVLGVIVLLFGLHLVGLLKIKLLYREKRVRVLSTVRNRYLHAFLLGLAFAFGWTPCITPILGGILTMAAQRETLAGGMVLLSVYSLGLWIPFAVAALFTVPTLSLLSKYPKLARNAQYLAGGMLIIMGVLLISGQMTRINALFQ